MPEMNPIFVIGNPRSGTTLLRLIITAHSQVIIPPESSLIVNYFTRYGHLKHFSRQNLHDFLNDLGPNGFGLEEQWEISLDDFKVTLTEKVGLSYAELCGSLYIYYAKQKGFSEKFIWGDKNNAYVNYIDVLAWLYPQARFVHIVRDGRAVLASYQALANDSHKYAPHLPKNAKIVAARWNDTISRITHHLEKYATERYIVVRYEDILTDFNRSVGQVCEFLGLSLEENMQKYHILNRNKNLEPVAYDSWKWRTREPIDPSRAEHWRSVLSSEDLTCFESLTNQTLVDYGYTDLNINQDKFLKKISLKYYWLRFNAKIREYLRRLRLQIVILRSRKQS